MSGEISASEYEAMTDVGQFPSGMVEFAELMIEDDINIPQDARKRWWGFFGKDTILTRSDNKDDRSSAANDFALSRNLIMMSMPAFDVNINQIIEFDQIRRRFMAQHKRSISGFERQALMTQIKELRTNKPQLEASGGIIAGLKKKIGLGSKQDEGNKGV